MPRNHLFAFRRSPSSKPPSHERRCVAAEARTHTKSERARRKEHMAFSFFIHVDKITRHKFTVSSFGTREHCMRAEDCIAIGAHPRSEGEAEQGAGTRLRGRERPHPPPVSVSLQPLLNRPHRRRRRPCASWVPPPHSPRYRRQPLPRRRQRQRGPPPRRRRLPRRPPHRRPRPPCAS
jgi:hypothetical protein